MLDIKFIRENLSLVEKNNKSRGVRVDMDSLLKADDRRKKLQTEIESLRGEKKKMSKIKPTEPEIAEMKKLGNRLKIMEEEFRKIENTIFNSIILLPNLNHESVPAGKDESENVVVKTAGIKPKFNFSPKHHFEVTAVKSMIDSESGAQISGSRFYFLKGRLVILERAIMEYGLEKAVKNGFEPVMPPLLVREKALYGTGFFPADKNEIYSVNPGEDNLFLIGTSEVPLVAMRADKIFEEKDLPKKYCSITPCFRREAGSYGKDQRGIFRVHQFYKVEMVVFSKPEDSWKLHEEIISLEESLLEDFGLPYRLVNICSGDLGFPAAKKYDLEGWFPGQKKYRELTSASNTTDFQARRLNIKYKARGGGKSENILVHTLNGTMVADRTLLAVIENCQTRDGNVVIPEKLQKFTGFKTLN